MCSKGTSNEVLGSLGESTVVQVSIWQFVSVGHSTGSLGQSTGSLQKSTEVYSESTAV